MDYFIIEYSKIRQQEIQQEFEAIHRARTRGPQALTGCPQRRSRI